MSKVFDGDEWRHAKPEEIRVQPSTRADRQSKINEAYALGRISVEEWRLETDRLSEPQRV